MIPIHAIPAPASAGGAVPILPSDKLCYLLGRNGLFKQVGNDFYHARVKVDGAGGLAEIEESASLHVPKLPLKLLRQAEAFFAAVFQRYKSEAVVLLLVDPKAQAWRIEVPPQVTKGLRVRYDMATLPAPPEGYERFGTIHSHANIKAFHSGTDDTDEVGFDGLHITIGNVNEPVRSYSARWMLTGKEFKADLCDVVKSEAPQDFDMEWMNLVRSDDSDDVFAVTEPRLAHLFNGTPTTGTPSNQGEAELFDENGFSSVEEYEQYLLAMREEIEDRLLEAGSFR